jgi:hypothetical protein
MPLVLDTPSIIDGGSRRNRGVGRNEKDEEKSKPCPNDGLLAYVTEGALLIRTVIVPRSWNVRCCN